MKTNRFLLAVACATMAFTLFACSDDKDDPPPAPTYGAGACFFGEGSLPLEGVTACMKTSKGDFPPAGCTHAGGVFMEDCPPNSKLQCPEDDKLIYLYGTPDGFKCSDMPHDDD
ncbi:MAG: hypothetical protein LBQ76_04880 [Candidatus Fibromonas sp.]|nr:hypothetical protein [Candidatus Fibromonas sp.]